MATDEHNGFPEPVKVRRELAKVERAAQRYAESPFFRFTEKGFQSSFFDPYTNAENVYGNLRTADRRLNREVDCFTLRRVSKKAWIINLCITNVQKKITPFLKPSTNRNLRGFVVHRKGEDVIKAAGAESAERKRIEGFLLNTGFTADSDRDGFVRYCRKIIRDLLEIDQAATEIGYTRAGRPYAFWAVDGATIEKVLPDQENPFNIKYVQLINGIPQAYYPEGRLVFDFQNPRSDVRYSFYGYSVVEQAIDLVTGMINAFTYNAGFFTENKLPKGLLLLDGNASQETVEQMEDYLCDIMSGSPSNQWRVPIIPAGTGKGGDAQSIRWVSLAGTNREMEFQSWLDFLTSGVVSLFGCSMEELGLHSSKSQPLFERNTMPEIEASKSLVLGDTLSFLQGYLNKILAPVFPEYELEFVGYERDDPKAVLDIAKGELDAYKTLNEIRAEKGLPKLSAKWADECPANPQFVQLYQAESMGGGAPGMEGMEEGGDGGDEADGWEDGDFGSADGDGNSGGAGDMESGGRSADEDGEEGDGMAKSFSFTF